MIDITEIKKRLGANYIEGTESVIIDIIKDITSIACDASNRKENDSKIYPYVKKAIVSEYLSRGAEGLSSLSESGRSSSFYDIEEKLRKDLICIRRIK